ncbi:DUF262 domain-containing protein [Rhodococcus maanshanensis]|uniref:GmrSD restriction endonuclease domain-containing protein n=1 Tax=Rhodococcus maanshanensis TaxID=183556 RepID=UPI0022B2CD9D|nr:DUF262 domain-containing protein [Rhodococcus maanshanensis]MCZ4555815.1 DUF262 domain-containing protein [Rhodococcus maanshanensis]
METAVRTPLEVFTIPQHLVVPIYQRRYVWEEEHQWEPLWLDLRRLAEHRLSGGSSTHFLGAIVVQMIDNQMGQIQQRAIIDGQQRLTTLQIVFDSVGAILSDKGFSGLSQQLEGLTHNPEFFNATGDSALKLRHSNDDGLGFDEVMTAEPPVEYAELEHADARIPLAHKYFSEEVGAWIGDGDEAVARAQALVVVLTSALNLVVIDLKADEDSQAIFETLNARGTPLTSADLIKNHVFQRLTGEGVDTAAFYKADWIFDTKWWEQEISVGRFPMSRSSHFLNQWLVSRVGELVGPSSTFGRFKHFADHEYGGSMSLLIGEINAMAAIYKGWTSESEDEHKPLDTVAMSVYRMQLSDVEAIKPVLLWLVDPGHGYSLETVKAVTKDVESWFVRRMLLRLSMSSSGRVVSELIGTHLGVPDSDLAARVRDHLTRLTADTTYWPDDDELRAHLRTENAYRRMKRARLRMLLEAAEDHLRGYTGTAPSKTGVRAPRVSRQIEHLMPVKWKTNWGVEGLQAAVDRDAHIHRLGNLTLLTGSLNASVSNGPWLGSDGKRENIRNHEVYLLNKRVIDASEAGWDEVAIDARTDEIIDSFLATWPVPEGHVRPVPQPKGSEDVSLRQLVASGFLAVGTILHAAPAQHSDRTCEVLDTGELFLEGARFTSPSGPARVIQQRSTNGWWFWQLPDGRRLTELRVGYLAAQLRDA